MLKRFVVDAFLNAMLKSSEWLSGFLAEEFTGLLLNVQRTSLLEPSWCGKLKDTSV
jgi:hypothetical protein